MSSQSAPDKSDTSRFAVIVDPGVWPHDLERLAEAVRTAYAASAPDKRPPALAALLERLRGGATTVAQGWARARAEELVAALRADGVQAKLLRRRTARGAGALPRLESRVPSPHARLARPVSAAAPAPAPAPAPRAAPKRPTLMDGWQHFAGEPAQGPASSSAVAASTGAAAVDTPSRAPSEGTAPRMPALGWGDVLEPGTASPQLGPPARDGDGVVSDERTVGRTEPRMPSVTAGELASRVAAAVESSADWPKVEVSKTAPSEAAERLGEHAAENRGEEPDGASDTRPQMAVPPLLRSQPSGLPGRAVPSEELRPRPWLAALLGVMAPGAGQIYLGQRDEGMRHAMGAPLLWPWVTGVRDAWGDALRIAAGRRRARARPKLWRALGFVLAIWLFVALVAGGSYWLYERLTAPSVEPARGAQVAAVPPEQTPPVPMVEAEGSAERERALADELEARQREARARRLTLQARDACDAADYAACADFADQARRLDPGLVQAVRLFHRASLALEQAQAAGSGDGTGRAGGPRSEEGSP